MKNTLIIRYSIGRCFLGLALMARTKEGICQVSIDDKKESQIQHLYGNFPKAEIIEDSQHLTKTLMKVTAFIDHPTEKVPVPLDMHGTDFQKQVWQALLEIRPGDTMTYAQLAQKIGNPTATRAVASANAANKIAVLIPCHRIIRSDGRFGGYRWGLERKRILLDREAQQNHDHPLTLF